MAAYLAKWRSSQQILGRDMRKSTLLLLPILAACSSEANHLGNPLALPINGLSAAIGNAEYNRTRGQVEVFVKTHHPALISDLRAGGGVTLTQAFDIAKVPQAVRAPHTLQMQSDLQLYESNLEALVIAIMVVNGAINLR